MRYTTKCAILLACAVAIAISPQPALARLLAGDANGDGTVDGADYTIWASSYGKTGQNWSTGDFNGDGTVNGADYTIWASHYGAHATPFVAATLPAPLASYYVNNQNAWAYSTIGLTQSVAAQGNYGRGVNIAVVSAGIDSSQPEFTGRVSPYSSCIGATKCTNDAYDDTGVGGSYGLGTIVANVAAGGEYTDPASSQKGIGIAPYAGIIAEKVEAIYSGAPGVTGNQSAIGDGIRTAAAYGAPIVNVGLYVKGDTSQQITTAYQNYIVPGINAAAALNSTVVLAGGDPFAGSDSWGQRFAGGHSLSQGDCAMMGNLA